MNLSAIKRVASIVFGEPEGKQITDFFNEIAKSNYDYVVLNSQNCFKLYNIFTSALREQTSFKEYQVISSNALLLYANKFAKTYNETKRFPKLILVDILANHGNDILQVLCRFEAAICLELEKIKGTTLGYSCKNLVWHYLREAVQIRVYAISRVPLLVEGLYRHDIVAKTERYDSDLKELSQKICSFIQELDKPNDYFLYSLAISNESNQKQKWQNLQWSYRGRKIDIYISPKSRKNVVSMVYIQKNDVLGNKGNSWLTGLTIGGEMPKSTFSKLCNNIKSIFEKYNQDNAFDFLIYILSQEDDYLQPQRAQFIYFLMSVINVTDFLADNQYYITNMSSSQENIDNIASNFGLYTDIREGFEKIIHSSEKMLDEISEVCYKAFYEGANGLVESLDLSTDFGTTQINCDIEQLFQKNGMAFEKIACDMSTNKKRFYPLEQGADIVTLKSLIETISKKQSNHSKDSLILSSLVCMAESGLATLQFNMDKEKKLRGVLKIEELSTFSIPRRWHYFIPAIAWVENECFDFSITPQEMAKEFISYLAHIRMTADYKSEASPEEQEALEDLIKNGNSYIDYLSYCHQSFNTWRKSLLTICDWREYRNTFGDKSYPQYLCNNITRQQYYCNQAKVFVGNKRKKH